jgi:peptide/nickel transport system permease protein
VVGYVIKRLAWGVVLALLITMITFFIFFILPPNQPGSNRQGIVSGNLQSQYDLESKSMPSQYVTFLNHVVHGNLGTSLRYNISVRDQIQSALPITLSLIIGGTIMWLLIAFPIGILSALYPRSMLDKGLMAFVLIGISAHPVWLGLVFSYFFGYRLHAFPIAGYCDFAYDPGNSVNQCGGPQYWAYHLVLPWFTFALLFAAFYARMIRATLLETMDEDYVRTARAKGAGEWRVLRTHVMRNALLPVVAMLSMDMVVISLTGVIFIETVYQLPGLGTTLYQALTTNDLPVVVGVVLVICVAVTIANLIADIVYCMIDPRLNLRGPRRGRSWGLGRLRPKPRSGITETATEG